MPAIAQLASAEGILRSLHSFDSLGGQPMVECARALGRGVGQLRGRESLELEGTLPRFFLFLTAPRSLVGRSLNLPAAERLSHVAEGF